MQKTETRPGGRLYYLDGERRVYFMEEKYGERGNLMPRDIVSKCIYDAPSHAQPFNYAQDGKAKPIIFHALITLLQKTLLPTLKLLLRLLIFRNNKKL